MKTLEQLRQQFPQYAEVSDGDFLMGINRSMYPDVHPRQFLNAIEGAANAHVTITNPGIRDWYRERVVAPMPDETPDMASRRLGGALEAPVGDPGGPVTSGARGALQGLTFGFGDEIVAAGASALSPNVTYEQALRAERDRLELGREQNPVASYGGEIGGAVALPLGAMNAVGNLGVRALKSAGLGGILSTIYGFGAGEGGLSERAENARDVGLLGAGISGAVPVVGAAIQRVGNGLLNERAVRQAARTAPSMDDLRTQAGRIFDDADAIQNLPRSGFGPVAQRAVDDALGLGMDDMLTPSAARVANNLTDSATAPQATIPYRELSILRRQAGIPAGDITNRPQAAIGSRMIDAVDEFGEASLQGVDPTMAARLDEARDMWSRLRKSEVIEDAIQRAQNQASGFENGIRTQFRAILNNPKRLRGFSKAEKDAMRQVVRGTPMGNLLRQVGRLGIDLNSGSNALGATVGSVLGTTLTGSPIGAIAVPALATLARSGANASTRRGANKVQGLLASGGVSNVPQITNGARGILEGLLRGPVAPLVTNQPR